MSTTTTTTTSSTTLDTEVIKQSFDRRREEAGLQKIKQMYMDIFGKSYVPEVHLKQIKYYQEVFDDFTIMMILEETANAPVPAFRYFLRICKQCQFEGIRNATQFLDRQIEHRRS